ncbi:ROK family protein [Natronogracilivirga saccharolytica]|uniref:ROK family protein n=1 Tax=Natronogracilivirga saccharolytica TaxID=2812953 RepID=A0A8J7UUW4_9BACT|nr:ROK family protein [Natronogracilivirga saccharolytica]MBP3192815.1 ROK family protein [Natronogracilivirga saccharolytica]
MLSIGIDLGGTNIKSALIHRDEGIIAQDSVPTDAGRGPDYVLDRIAESVQNTRNKATEDPVGIGIGSPGIISLDRTTVSNPPNLPGWDVVNVNEELKKRTGLDAVVENDANLMALGSSRYGEGQDLDSLIMLTLGTGVGGGIIINRELYRGATGAAAELGHVIINFDGPSSNSKAKGGVEAYIGQRFLIRNALPLIKKHPDNTLAKEYLDKPEALEPVHLSREADRGNNLAVQILSEAGRMLGYAIVNYIHILDIRNIIVSGGVAKAGDWILEPARAAARERLLPPYLEGFQLSYESLGNDAALLGAGSLAFELLANHR